MIRCLDDLLELLNDPSDRAWSAAGLAINDGERDVLNLPKFDDLPPDERMEVYSWDRDRMIVGALGGPYSIVLRVTHDEEFPDPPQRVLNRLFR